MANGHFGRILEAKAAMKRILKPGTPAYFIHDTDLARGMGLSTPTLRALRKELGIPPREERILAVVRTVGTAYLDDYLAKLPGVTYHCLYMLLRLRKVPFLKRSDS